MNAQAKAALEKGHRIRIARQKLRREIRALPREQGFALVADIVEHTPECCLTATVFDLLMAVKFMGREYTLKLIREWGFSELRTCGELTERQRAMVAATLRPEAVAA